METNHLFRYQKNIETKNCYKFIIFIFIFFIISINSISQNNYYWSNNRKIFLTENRSSIIINFTEIKSELQKLKKLSAPHIESFTIDSVDNCLIINFNTIQQKSINKVVKNLGVTKEKIKSASFSLMTKEGGFIWLTNRIILKFKQGNGLQSIRNIMNEYDLSLYKSSYDMVILEVTDITNALLASNTLLTSEIAASINWAWQNGADVLSNSWGYNCDTYFDDIANAITNARTQGRNGKGSIVVFAAGNNFDDCVTFPANVSGVIAVGAIDKNGQLWDYSAHGNRLDVVAPSGACNLDGDVYTIDRMGNDGFNPFQTSGDLLNTNYTSKFGGTSAACPEVSGVAALMLSVNPNLSEQQASNIIRKSVTDMGINGKDYYFGYGCIDASRALFESIILQEPSCQYTKGYLNLTCINNNKKITFTKSPKTGIAAGTYFAEEYIADATINFSTPFIWYKGKGLSGANPNNGEYYLIKNDNGSSIYLQTWFYYIKHDAIGNNIEQWVPDDPNNSDTRNYVAAPPESLKLKNIIVNIGESKNYQATNTIIVASNDSYFVVEGNGTDGGNSILKAGISITLNSGFHAQVGSYFHSYIEPNCLTSSNFCSTTQKMLFNNKYEYKLYTITDTNNISNPLEKKITMKNKNIESQLTIYPNPNNGLFSIVLNNNDSRINSMEIYNLIGNQVLSKNGLNSNLVKLNISNFPKDIYFVRIYSNNKTYLKKIIYE